FGADAVLFIKIKDWSTKYLVLVSSVVVEMEYILKDTRTGAVLWESSQTYHHNSGGGGNLIAMAVSAAVNALLTDYRPLAQQSNRMVFLPPKGLPAGPYHPEYRKDQTRFE
ncbi:MAG: GNA1162 family protein, partial [Methylococcales bacterium]